MFKNVWCGVVTVDQHRHAGFWVRGNQGDFSVMLWKSVLEELRGKHVLAVQQFESKLSANFSQFAIDLTHPDKFLKAGLFDSVQGVVVCKALDAIGQDEMFRRP